MTTKWTIDPDPKRPDLEAPRVLPDDVKCATLDPEPPRVEQVEALANPPTSYRLAGAMLREARLAQAAPRPVQGYGPTAEQIVAMDDERNRGDAAHYRWSGVTVRTRIAWRGRPISDAEVHAARGRIAASSPPTDAEIVAMRIVFRGLPISDAEVQEAVRNRIAAKSILIVGDLAPPAPPTDEEIVSAVEHANRAGCESHSLAVVVRGVSISDEDVRAAWSRVLAAKVAASDEQRRRDAMVYGPIDDGDEAGADDA